MALHYAYVDVDGQAVSVFGSNGSLVSTEVTGAYGVPLQGAPSDYSSSPEAWVVDGLHGQEEDRGNEVSHFGARHTLFRDGMWMQPEPLLGLGMPGFDRSRPQALGSLYAQANPVAGQDTTGWCSFLLTWAGCGAPKDDPPNGLEWIDEALSIAYESSSTDEQGTWTRYPNGGSLDEQGKDTSAEELAAAREVARMGRTVVTRDPVGRRSREGSTADLLVDGIPMDVYTPEAGTEPRTVLNNVAGKNGQAQGVVLNLVRWDRSAEELGSNVLEQVSAKINGRGNTVNLREVIVVGEKE